MFAKTFAFVFASCCFLPILSHRFCYTDNDCSVLGNLICIRSMCRWGTCGCERGYVARYISQLAEFQCVRLKKIGDFCSTASITGVCGAPNSECIDEVCRCVNGTVPRISGELCIERNRTFTSEGLLMGDTCGYVQTTPTSHLISFINITNPIVNIHPQCSCPRGFKTELINSLHLTPFQGRKWPLCMPIRIGNRTDVCVQNIDCPSTSHCDAESHFCQCSNEGWVPNYDGSICGQPLQLDDKCTRAGIPLENWVCDGTSGLVCGDVCDFNLDGTSDRDLICACGPSYRQIDRACVQNVETDFCFGDYNCKSPSLGYNGICRNSTCINGAVGLTYPILSIFFTIRHI